MKKVVHFDPPNRVRSVAMTKILCYNASIGKVIYSGIETRSSLCNTPNPNKSSSNLTDAKTPVNGQDFIHRFLKTIFMYSLSSEGGMDPLLISYSDLCNLLGLSKSTIKRKIKSGQLPQPITFSKTLKRFNLFEVKKFLGRLENNG
tara:strand:+ start:21 stop:458 length:438 start_codon:yes stop_codon:yes gene_type:complete